MSYCVNCGVELGSAERKCPLCGVAVYNPIDHECGGERAFPTQKDTVESAFDKDLWMRIVTILLTVPAAICLVANMLMPTQPFWAFYVVGGLAVGWTFCVSPFLFKRYFPLLWIVANTVASLGYLFLIESLSQTHGWFLPLALPIVLGVAVLSLAVLVLMQRRVLTELNAAAGIFGALGLLTVLIEMSVSLYSVHSLRMEWSWYSLISCAAMAVVLVFIERKLMLKEKLKRKMHI